ncbi:MAG TPA: phytoene/squalene synthase family protein [Terriglobales bacterium]|nr:phytoene/squalene synthase family protein [Terriglobales bacterium]
MSVSQLTTAYAVCRGIARRRARNFYYSFRVLPTAKRNALSAVYAFMRHADDISDDESATVVERRERLQSWLDEWHQVQAGTPSNDPVFVALADAQRKYRIPPELLDQLVQGTSMDLPAPAEDSHRLSALEGNTAVAASSIRIHRTFADLYEYCYLVASVVGLVCIRIYQYEDLRAEQLAERCGVAFQLTNIIRDVKEDAAMGRVYFPEEDLHRFGLTIDDFLLDKGARLEQSRLAPLLEFQAQRAREYYASAGELIPLIHEDSRAALWVMVTIYQRLLGRIAERNYDVLHGRVRLSGTEKMRILARGIIRSVFERI